MYLDGEISKDVAVEMIVTRTRQFAVRQERWFRRDPRVRWIDVEDDPVAEVAPVVIAHFRQTAMTSLTLTKHHGLGNDFVVAFQPGAADLSALARRLCDRRTGIGADGLLIAESKEGYAAKMVLYNADGSRAEMSGNGIRCFAQALAMRQRRSRSPAHLDRRSATAWSRCRSTDDPHTISARVEMGDVVPLCGA